MSAGAGVSGGGSALGHMMSGAQLSTRSDGSLVVPSSLAPWVMQQLPMAGAEPPDLQAYLHPGAYHPYMLNQSQPDLMYRGLAAGVYGGYGAGMEGGNAGLGLQQPLDPRARNHALESATWARNQALESATQLVGKWAEAMKSAPLAQPDPCYADMASHGEHVPWMPPGSGVAMSEIPGDPALLPQSAAYPSFTPASGSHPVQPGPSERGYAPVELPGIQRQAAAAAAMAEAGGRLGPPASPEVPAAAAAAAAGAAAAVAAAAAPGVAAGRAAAAAEAPGGPCSAEDGALREEIASAVASFLNGSLEDEEDGEEDGDLDLLGGLGAAAGGGAAAAPEAAPTGGPGPPGPPPGPPAGPPAEDRAAAPRPPGGGAGPPERCLQRGRLLGAELSRLHLPSDVREEALPRLHAMISGCIQELYQARRKPTVVAVQQKLRGRGLEEATVQLVLPICAREPDLFRLWLPSDGQVSVLLAREQIQDFILEEESFQGPYSPEFLEVFTELFNRKIASAAAAGHLGSTPGVCNGAGIGPEMFVVGSAAFKGDAPSASGAIGLSRAAGTGGPAGGAGAPGLAAGGASPLPASGGLSAGPCRPGPLGDGGGAAAGCAPSCGGGPDAAPDAAAAGPPSGEAARADATGDEPEGGPEADPERAPSGPARRKEPARVNYDGTSHSAPNLAASLQAQGISTLMIRNLPHNVTQKRLVEEIASSGFAGMYDFCYMPSTFGTGVTKGYAFINLTSAAALGAFVTTWHGSRRFGIAAMEASLNVSAAALQGLEENVRKWDAPRMRRVRNPALRPLVIGAPGAEAEPPGAAAAADGGEPPPPAPPPGLSLEAPEPRAGP